MANRHSKSATYTKNKGQVRKENTLETQNTLDVAKDILAAKFQEINSLKFYQLKA